MALKEYAWVDQECAQPTKVLINLDEIIMAEDSGNSTTAVWLKGLPHRVYLDVTYADFKKDALNG